MVIKFLHRDRHWVAMGKAEIGGSLLAFLATLRIAVGNLPMPKASRPKAVKTDRTSAERGIRFREEKTRHGLTQCLIWASPAHCAELRQLAELLQKHPHLSVAMLRDSVSGRLVPLK